jgi:hypothetical protein
MKKKEIQEISDILKKFKEIKTTNPEKEVKVAIKEAIDEVRGEEYYNYDN